MPESPIRLSVVIPTHDTADLVERCLRSLEAAGASGLQVIVVDDGSRDGTAERLAMRFPWAHLIRHQTALGFTASVNDGLAVASGELLLLLNSDTEMQEGSLEALVSAFDADAALGVAGAALHNPDGSPQWSAGREPSLAWLFALASGLGRWARVSLPLRRRKAPGHSVGGPADWVTGAAMAFRRQVQQQLGPLETAYRFYVQDMDYCLRARAAGFGVAVIPGFRVMHVGGATVGRSDGAVGSSHPELLMADLVTWAALRRGPSFAREVRFTLRLGLGLRIATRRLQALVMSPARREAYRSQTESLRLAARAL